MLSALDLTKVFDRRVVFRGVTFEVAPGQVLGVTGRNGAGKSTLVGLLAGTQTPTAGTVMLTVDGRAIAPPDRPLNVGLVAPYLVLYDEFTPTETLRFLAGLRGLRVSADEIAALLDRVELSDRADDPVGQFSSGLKGRMKYAAALLHRPPVLLLDEPRANLDRRGVALVGRVVADARAAGQAVVIATNDAPDLDLCDGVLDLGGGEGATP